MNQRTIAALAAAVAAFAAGLPQARGRFEFSGPRLRHARHGSP